MKKTPLATIFREAAASDLPQITKVYGQCFEKNVEDPEMAELAMSCLFKAKELNFFVAEQQNKVVGFSIMRIYERETPANLDYLGVDDEHRGKGIGHRLMRQAESSAQDKGFQIMTLQVNAFNDQAFRLYKGTGYNVVDVLPQFYPDGEPALEMEKKLNTKNSVPNLSCK